eukprot:COSAG01_NODE_24562_length_774_cov_5.572738_1_plen_159_part_00
MVGVYRLLADRRDQLDALKRGFTWASDLRPALQLFDGSALHTLYCPSRWASAARVIGALQFAGFSEHSTTPGLFLELLKAWERNGGVQLTELLLWWTSSDVLGETVKLIVEPLADARGFCESATCTCTLRLPSCQALTLPELEQRLLQSMSNVRFDRE